MDRRRFLTGTGVAVTIGMAGCGSPGGDGGGEGEDGGGETPEAGETPEEGDAGAEETPDEETPEETPGEDVDGNETGEMDESDEMNETDGNETAGNETEGNETAGDGAGGGGTSEVRMATEGDEYIFDPIGLHVEPGTTVTWTNESGSHSSTAYAEGNGGAEVTLIPEDAEPWDSGILSEEGATFEYTFETEGTYDYFCQPHKTLGMIARIVVGEPGGPAEGEQPPDGEVPESQQIVDQGSISWDEFQG